MFLFRRCSHKVKSCKQPMTFEFHLFFFLSFHKFLNVKNSILEYDHRNTYYLIIKGIFGML